MKNSCFLAIFVIFSCQVSADAEQTRFKLYCMYTPKFQILYEDFFLPSLKDEFDVVAKNYEQECPSGVFLSSGWNKTMMRKLELLRDAIYENANNQVFFYSDVDIIFLNPILQAALKYLGDKDFVIQQGWPRNMICAGFLVMRGNERTLNLILRALELMKTNAKIHDQKAIQIILERLTPHEIVWDFLPSLQFPNGRRILKNLQNGKELYSPESEIELDDSLLLFHANCTIGLSNKYHFLKRVQEEYAKKD